MWLLYFNTRWFRSRHHLFYAFRLHPNRFFLICQFNGSGYVSYHAKYKIMCKTSSNGLVPAPTSNQGIKGANKKNPLELKRRNYQRCQAFIQIRSDIVEVWDNFWVCIMPENPLYDWLWSPLKTFAHTEGAQNQCFIGTRVLGWFSRYCKNRGRCTKRFSSKDRYWT